MAAVEEAGGEGEEGGVDLGPEVEGMLIERDAAREVRARTLRSLCNPV